MTSDSTMRKFDSDKTLQLSMYLKIVACFLDNTYKIPSIPSCIFYVGADGFRGHPKDDLDPWMELDNPDHAKFTLIPIRLMICSGQCQDMSSATVAYS